MRVRTLLLPLVLLVVFAVPAAAQRGQNELTVFGGVSLSDVRAGGPADIETLRLLAPDLIFPLPSQSRSVSLDGSAEFGARYGRRLTDRVTAEVDFSVAPSHQLDERIGFGCPPDFFCIAAPAIELFAPDLFRTTSLVAYHYGGGVRLDLMRGSIRPSVIGGIGAVTYDGTDVQETNLALRLGGAVSARVGSATTRIEVVDVIVADHFATGRAEHDVHVRVGIGVRW